MAKPDQPEVLAVIAEFKKAEALEAGAIALSEDGFDAATLRVLASLAANPGTWRRPSRPCPDGGAATPAAWRWVVSGWTVDYLAVAEAAGTSKHLARDRAAMLIGNRLVYPTGELAKAGRGILQSALRRALGRQKKQDEGQRPTKESAPPPRPPSGSRDPVN